MTTKTCQERQPICSELVSLPSNLPKLKVLKLKHCRELVSLPDEIQSFKDLNELEIIHCRHLSERYENEMAVDWHKISHVPNIPITPLSKCSNSKLRTSMMMRQIMRTRRMRLGLIDCDTQYLR